MTAVSASQRLVWVDLEMTGLDPLRDHILEIASIVTDHQLQTIAEGPVLAIFQSSAVLERMDEWNQRQHQNSGLIDRVKASKESEVSAAQATLRFLQQHVSAKQSPMCGNSICQDRRFMARLMPELEAFFHYRNLDVSSVKEIVRRWAPEVAQGFVKQGSHLALDDIRESIAELRYYRQQVFCI